MYRKAVSAICVLYLSTLSATLIDFQPFDTHPGIFYEDLGKAALSNNEFKFILYYNLTGYWTEWAHVEACTLRLQGWCNGNMNLVHEHDHCTEISHNIQLLQDGIRERNQLLKPVRRMKRAPLEFLGNVLGDVFGVLDQRDAAQYHQDILRLQEDNAHAQELLQKQTQVLDVTTNVLKKEAERIDKQYQTITQQFQRMDAHNEMVDLALQLTLALITIGDTQGALVDVLTDVHHGRMNARLITPQQLEQELLQLQPKLPHTVRFPPYQNQWVQLYKVMTLRGTIRKQVAIFEMKLPLLSQEEFQIFKTIPVPTIHQAKFVYIEPSSPYLLVNQQKTWFYPVSHLELEHCHDWDDKFQICEQYQPLHSKSSLAIRCEVEMMEHAEIPDKSCLIRSMLPSTYLVPLQNGNTWISVFPEETTVDVVCAGNSETIKLQGSGLLTLPSGCTLRNKHILITSKTTYISARNTSFLPRFNLTDQMKRGNIQAVTTNIDAEFLKLDDAMRQLHAARPWNKITKYDMFQYGVNGTLWVAIVVILAICWHRRSVIRQGFSNSSRSNTPVTTIFQGEPPSTV